MIVITDEILKLLGHFVGLLKSAIPNGQSFRIPPDAMASITEWSEISSQYASGLDGWIQVSTLVAAGAFVMTSFTLHVALRAARMTASHLTGGGGSAA